jgi:prophage regulatory protein
MYTPAPKALRQPEVIARTRLSRTTLWRRIKVGDFPKPFPLGSGRAVGWLESEVSEWLEAQAAKRVTRHG